MLTWILRIFIAAYALALAIFAVGAFGWLGQQRSALAGLFLVPLGLPWNLVPVPDGGASIALLVLAPLLNLAILAGLARLLANAPQ